MEVRFILIGVLCFVLFLLAVMIIRTRRFKSKQLSDDSKIDGQEDLQIDGDGAVARLQKAISFKTISDEHYFPGNKIEFLDFHKFLEEAFPEVHRCLKREVINELSLIYAWEGTERELKPVLFLAHMDVVPADERSIGEWEFPPFEGRAGNGYVWGRGTMDDKGCLLALLEAVEELLKRGYTPRRKIYFAFGHDEETGGKQGACNIAEYFKQKKISFEYTLDEGLLITKDVLKDIKAPIALIGIAEKGYVSLELTANCDGGHSSMPGRDTAIGILSNALSKLAGSSFPAKIKGPVKLFFDYTGPHMSLIRKTVFANLWFFAPLVKKILSMNNTTNAMIRTTIAPTMLEGGIKDNVLPSAAKGVINCRIIPGETVRDVVERIKRIISDPRVNISLLPHNIEEPSKVSSIKTIGFKSIQQTIFNVFKSVIIAPSLVMAGTDSKHYAALSENSYRFIPLTIEDDDRKRIHGINERIAIENYMEMIRFYIKLFKV